MAFHLFSFSWRNQPSHCNQPLNDSSCINSRHRKPKLRRKERLACVVFAAAIYRSGFKCCCKYTSTCCRAPSILQETVHIWGMMCTAASQNCLPVWHASSNDMCVSLCVTAQVVEDIKPVLAAFLSAYERSNLQHGQPAGSCHQPSLHDFRQCVELVMELLFAPNTRPFHRSVISALRRVTGTEHQGEGHMPQVSPAQGRGQMMKLVPGTCIATHFSSRVCRCSELLQQVVQERLLHEAAQYLTKGDTQQAAVLPGGAGAYSATPAPSSVEQDTPGAAAAPPPPCVDQLPRAVLGQTVLSLSAMPEFMRWVRPVAVEVLAVVALHILDVLAAADAGVHLPPALVSAVGTRGLHPTSHGYPEESSHALRCPAAVPGCRCVRCRTPSAQSMHWPSNTGHTSALSPAAHWQPTFTSAMFLCQSVVAHPIRVMQVTADWHMCSMQGAEP
jgi:hypothetical protein